MIKINKTVYMSVIILKAMFRVKPIFSMREENLGNPYRVVATFIRCVSEVILGAKMKYSRQKIAVLTGLMILICVLDGCERNVEPLRTVSLNLSVSDDYAEETDDSDVIADDTEKDKPEYIKKFGVELKLMDESGIAEITGIWEGKQYLGSRHTIAWDNENDRFIISCDSWLPDIGFIEEKVDYYSCECKLSDSDELKQYFSGVDNDELGLYEKWFDISGTLIYVDNGEGDLESRNEVLMFLTDDGGIIRDMNDTFGYYERVGKISPIESDSLSETNFSGSYEDAFIDYGGIEGYYEALKENDGLQGLVPLSEEEKSRIDGYWVCDDLHDVMIFYDKSWIRSGSADFETEYYRDESVVWGGKELMIVRRVRYDLVQPVLAERLFFYDGDEIIVVGMKDSSRYLREGDVELFENYGELKLGTVSPNLYEDYRDAYIELLKKAVDDPETVCSEDEPESAYISINDMYWRHSKDALDGYSLHDVNRDGIPELFIYSGSCEIAMHAHIYTLKDQKLYYIGHICLEHSHLSYSVEREETIRYRSWGSCYQLLMTDNCAMRVEHCSKEWYADSTYYVEEGAGAGHYPVLNDKYVPFAKYELDEYDKVKNWTE